MKLISPLRIIEENGGFGGLVEISRQKSFNFDMFCFIFQIPAHHILKTLSKHPEDVQEYQEIINELNAEYQERLLHYNHETREQQLESMLDRCFDDSLTLFDVDKEGKDIRQKGLMYDLRNDSGKSIISIGLEPSEDLMSRYFGNEFQNLELYFSGREYLSQILLFAGHYLKKTKKTTQISERLSTYNLT